MGNRGRPRASACHNAKQSGGAVLEFLGRNVLIVGRDPPAMAGRVLEFAVAIAIELISDRPKNLGVHQVSA